MSTGENINANGMVLSSAIVRQGFLAFPQTIVAAVNPAQWPQIAPLQIVEGYPFKALKSDAVPSGQVWFIGTAGELLGRIVNVGNPTT
jgi:hypothetical protein